MNIPKNLHYIWFTSEGLGKKPWSLIHYVCVRSAIENIKPDEAYIYYDLEPKGVWWEKTLEILTPIKIKAPTEIFGTKLLNLAHKADITRLEILIEKGGIYLDADVFVHKSFDDLLQNSVVMGAQANENGIGIYGLANSIILSERNSSFLKKWYSEYINFNNKGWSEHSVALPYQLAQKFSAEVKILSTNSFFWPL